MNGEGHALMDLSKVRLLEIPFFQRAYVWGNPDFDELLDSLNDAPAGRMPFFGSLILKHIKETNEDIEGKHYLVIDGQQRITTFSILIRVILDLLDKDAKENNNQTYNIALNNINYTSLTQFLYIVKSEGMKNVYTQRLVPAEVDAKAFKAIMSTEYMKRNEEINKIKADDADNPVIHAYEYFYDHFSGPQKISLLMSVFTRLVNQANSLIWIILDENDDEQKIFNSVNSLGKNLTSADIIKNNLFQKIKEKATDKENRDKYVIDFYSNTWTNTFDSTIELKSFWYKEITVGRILTSNLEMFLKDYAIIYQFYHAKDSGGFSGLNKSYNEYIKNKTLDQLESFINDMCDYANSYYQYKKAYAGNTSFIWDDYVNRLLLIMDAMNTTTFDPYILKVMKENGEDKEQRLFNLEKFFLKRFVYCATGKNYNQCCENLIKKTYDGDQSDIDYFVSYMKESPAKNDSYIDKFRSMTNDQGKLFIYLLEMIDRKEKGITRYSDNFKTFHDYTLEHIMPQKWNEHWSDVKCQDEKGNIISFKKPEDFNRVRNNAIKSLGNFALLTGPLNASVGNAAFKTKINGNEKYEGIKYFSGNLKIAKELVELCNNNVQWNEKLIFEHEKAYFDKLNQYYSFLSI